MKKSILSASLVVLPGLAVLAQGQYSVSWHKIAGGGGSGTSASGRYSLSGTVGQSDASNTLTGTNYSLTGGFWSLFAVQSSGAPLLTISLTSSNTVMVTWPSPSTGFNLQVNADLNATGWNVPAETVMDDGTHKYILVNPTAGSFYYRLKRP